MPRLSELSGIAIFMYWLDHLPPHFHAITAEHEAVVAIANGRHLRCALGGPLEALNDPLLFAQVRVDPVARTICWPNGIDLDPDVLHGDAEPATGAAPRVLSEHHLRPAG